jgi:hypothetical protein
MYLKYQNNTITYPYSFTQLRQDNPLTCFPSDVMNGSHNELLTEYNVYPIIDNPPELNTNEKIINKTLVNNETNFYYEYDVTTKTDEELRQEKYNPIGFMESLADNQLFQQWALQANQSPGFSFMMIAYQNNNFDRVQAYYNALKASYPLPENAITEWELLANEYGINLAF